MDNEGIAQKSNKSGETDFVLQWGNRKRMRYMKVKEPERVTSKPDCLGKKKVSSNANGDRRVVSAEKASSTPQNYRLNKNVVLPTNNQRTSATSPEKEDRYYTTRGSMGVDEKASLDQPTGNDRKGFVWPRLFLSLSSKEKEEDFMAMKGCKLPQRPKKRAKLLQKSLVLVMPGSWLSDLCQERYEVREKKTSKKRPRGLKAMRSMDSDSE
ncbi:uncharacterized protein LOC111016452 [Momordica charantia]|uniref:Uncharacterized protein LOC111016452 n=1 Tax=Momordica charantia TaxID=3673 RepID=A0A6J1D1C5_MOMCH|nr:uncharacterized protein LOC111016452 [Momordica charantia]XP_022147555.1 uncharacterized protein LOC111016452 [Momordica charantia]XP_022147556.1 uncharacterized protein LOC111016452 [Momordica charantia]